MQEDKKLNKTNLKVLLISILIGLFFCEFFLRLTWKNYWNEQQRYIILKEHTPSKNTEYSREGIVKHSDKIKVNTNNDGFLLPDRIDKGTKNSLTIAFLGGSTTECFWVSENLRWPFIVSKLIADNFNITVNALNAGISGGNSHHSINVLLNKIYKYNPDLVFIMHSVNDAGVLLQKGNYLSAMITSGDESILKYLSQEIYLIGFFRHLRANWIIKNEHRKIFKASINDDIYYLDETPLKLTAINKVEHQYISHIRMLVDMIRDMNGIPILITEPFLHKISQENSEKYFQYFITGINYTDHFNNIIRNIADEKKTELIDLEKLLKKDKNYFYDAIHYNDAGSKEVGRIVFENLSNNRFLTQVLESKRKF